MADNENNSVKINEDEKSGHQGKRKKVIIILAVCMVAVVIAASWSRIAPDKLIGNLKSGAFSTGTGKSYPCDIVGTTVDDGNFSMFMNNISYVSDTSFIACNSTAKEVINRQIGYNSPMYIQNGEYGMIYNLGGTGYRIETTSETALKDDTSDNIITADITPKGVFGLVTQDKGYLSKLTVYNADHSQKFAYSFSEYYVTGLSISDDGSYAAVSGVTTDNGTVMSALYILDFTKSEPVSLLKFKDNMFYKVKIFDNGNVACIGDSAIEVVNSNYKDHKSYSFDGSELTQYKIDKGSGIALSLSRTADGHSCDLVYINNNGDKVSQTATNMKISGMDVYGDKICVLSYGKVYVYSRNGNKYNVELDAGVDARALVMESESRAYILAVSQIRVIDL